MARGPISSAPPTPSASEWRTPCERIREAVRSALSERLSERIGHDGGFDTERVVNAV
jgi:hypothetical protein